VTTLKSLGFDSFFSEQFERLGAPDLVPARIASEGQSSFHLVGCRAAIGDLSGKLMHSQGKLERPVAGDWVAVLDGPSRANIQHVFERRTTLIRRSAGTKEEAQVVGVNVDVFFVVTSLNRDFNERRLERYIAAVWNSGAEPVVVLNKIDLAGDTGPMLAAIGRAAIDVPIVQVSAVSGHGLDELRGYISDGRTIAFIGSSGVGKSSLMNRLVGEDVQAVAGLRADQRGRHTTTARQLVELPQGGLLIDTPGMRELGLLEDSGGVDVSFTDVLAFAEACRFRDCGHTGEPGCAVDAAVAQGKLPAARLASYRKLLKEVAVTERKADPILAGRS
jgi:ribosome biogenesis GTPase